MKIPEQYLPVMPYLILDDATAFLDFAKSVFNATEQLLVPGELPRSIMHGEIRIGQAVIMFAQATSEWKKKPAGMFIYVDNVDETYQTALRKNASMLMEPALKEYGYSAGFEDPLGNQWWITQGVTE